MPKRKNDEEDISFLERKIRKLEKKLRKKQKKRRSHRSRTPRSRTRSLSSRSSHRSVSRETTPRQQGNEGQGQGHIDDKVVEIATPNDEPLPSISAQATVVATAPGASDHSVAPALDNVVENIESSPELDDTILDILGIDPTQQNIFGAEIQKELAVRLEYYACNGLTKEVRKELKEQYLVPNNCKLINAPALNAELKAALTDVIINRDKAIELKQSQLASAISALGRALTRLFSYKEKDADLIKNLMDTSRILCDCQYSDSMRRRGFVLSFLRKDLKDPLLTTKIDNYLFGQELADTLKAAKAINKSGTELKAPPAPKPPINKKQATNSARPLNWKGPGQARRQPEHQRTREPAPTKNRHSSSSKPSQHRQQRSRRR